jgi:hypothetical protein
MKGIGRGSKAVVIVLLGVLVGGAVSGCSVSPEAAAQSREDAARIDALMMSQQLVRERLTSPQTARLPLIVDREVAVTRLGEHKWAVLGYIDHQNLFGADVRTRYRCQLREEGEYWRLLALKLEE